MGILEVFMHSFMTMSMSKIPFVYYYIPLFSSLILFLWLYKKQVGVDDTNYLNEMIEHHSMALLTSEEILKKTTNPQVKELAEKIIKTQNAEIQQMKNIGNEEFTKHVDSLREECLGGPYCSDVSQVAVGALLGLQPDDNPQV